MRKTFTILIALLLSFTWASAQSNVGKLLYSQMGSIVNNSTGYSSWNAGSAFMGGTYYSADDFTVPAGGWSMYGVSAIFDRQNYFTNIKVTVYEDNGGIPGNIWATTDVTSYEVVQLGYNVYQYTIKFPESVIYDFELDGGTYWLSLVPAGTFISNMWLTLASETNIGNPAKQKDIAGWPTTYTNWSTKNDIGNDNSLTNDLGDVFYHNLAFAILATPEDNDLSLKEIISPIKGELTATHPVVVAIENTGLNTQTSFQVMYQVSATVNEVFTEISTATETITGSYAADSIFEYAFTQKVDLSALNTYSVAAKVILTGDTNPANDMAIGLAKNYGNLFVMGTDTIVTTCSGVFTDDQGVSDNGYTEASYDTITFYPGTDGNRISLDFTLIDINWNDPKTWTFYDGNSTGAPILYQYTRDLKNWWTGPITARNAEGSMTVVLVKNQVNTTLGWEANVNCVVPEGIDFMALSLNVGKPAEYNRMNTPVDVAFSYTNAGKDTVARKAYLFENGTLIDSMMTKAIVPGVQDTMYFTWSPSLASTSVDISVQIQDDPQATNDNNALTTKVATYRNDVLLESFETASLAPGWMSIKNGYSQNTTSASYIKHGSASAKIAYVDTLVMPLMSPVAGDSLMFWSYIPSSSASIKVLASKSLSGPWTEVGTASYITYTIQEYKFDLSTYTDGPYYFAFATVTTSTYSSFYFDNVRGGTLYHYENDLLAYNLTSASTYLKSEHDAVFSTLVYNVGTGNIAGGDYSVQLRTVDSVYTTVKGLDVAANGGITITMPYTFITPDTLALYAEIVMEGEVRTDNNITTKTSYYIVDAYTVLSGSYYTTNTYVIRPNYQNSIAQYIYYPSEVGLYGELKGVEFTYTVSGSGVGAFPLQVYVGTIADSAFALATGSTYLYQFVNADSVTAPLTKVFDDSVEFINTTAKQNFYIPFDEVYNYDGSKNLVVTFVKPDMPKVNKTITIDFFRRTGDYKISVNTGYRTATATIDNINMDSIVVTNTSGMAQLGGSGSSNTLPNLRWYFNNPGAPEFESTPVETVFEREAYSYTAEFAYTSPKQFVMTAPALPSWLTLAKLTDTTYTLTGIAEAGVFPVELVVTDSSYSQVQRFDITGYAVPEFISEPVVAALVNEVYSYTAQVSFNGAGFAQITAGENNPAWVSITDNGNNTATVTGTPTAVGDYAITLIAHGEAGSTVEQVFTVTVGVVPAIAQLDNVTIIEGTEYAQTVTVDYEGLNTLTIAAGEAFPKWLTLVDNGDKTATLSGTSVMGEYVVNVIATDSTYSDTMSYTIKVDAVPVIAAIEDVVIEEGAAYTDTVFVAYNDTTAISILAGENFPLWLTITDNGDKTATITGTGVVGEYPVQVIATDGTYYDTLSFNISVGGIPTFTSTPVTTGSENSVYTYNVTTAINGSETLAITSDELPTWLTLTDNGNGTAVITGTPTTMGVYHVSLKAAGTYFSATQAYDIDITVGVNDVAANNFVVYPNPASQYIQILNIDKATIEIFDITGQLVKVQESVFSTDKIDVSEMNNGIYMIVLTNNQGKASKRLVIE